ncbi:phosphatase PAP2 family protein [Fulvivirga sediminis]|uniref:PA-phosphatase n=1 Tax=Fulvivirga sediminis TaxID=2803949 RepID=A0A937K1T2_9BACT|nr:PA-phosphatase [Fulvivirga sediminis]MBL3658899.1 PA-phosphatase [Fulvivirga sediminis]
MATLLVLTLYFFAPSVILPVGQSSVLAVVAIIFVLTYLLPIVSVLMLKVTNSISSIRLEDRKERLLPFSFITMWYGLASYFFISKPVFGVNFMVMFGAMTVTILLITIVTCFYKISAHSAGTAGLLAFLLVFHYKYLDSMLFIPLMVALVLHGLVCSSRLYLNSHSPSEVHFGSLLGFSVNLAAALLIL